MLMSNEAARREDIKFTDTFDFVVENQQIQ